MVRILAGIALSALVFAAAAADLKTKVAFDIAPQQLPSALLKYSEQSGIQVTCQGDIVEGKMTPGVTGTLEARGALDKLLQGTNLRYEVIDARTVTIRVTSRTPDSAPGKVMETGAIVSREPVSLRMAQAETAKTQAGSPPASKEEQTTAEDEKGVPEVLVKGSKILNMDVKRTEDDARPYVVFDRATIERSGAVNLQDFFKNRLTMGTSSQSDAEGPASATGNSTTINLRGLGTDETLILIDGRRIPAYSVRGSTGQPDLNGITLSAIERIEVLPSSAAGIYGGSATGGVVNIIMRRDYTGVETTVTYANTFDTDVAKRRVDLNGGFNLGSKTNLLMSASYSDSEKLLTQDRDFQMAMRRHVYTTSPGTYLNSNFSPLLGATTNIRGNNGVLLTLKGSNLPLNRSTTYVPYGYAGPASDNGQAFITNAGKYNIDLADNAAYGSGQGRRLAITNAPEVKSGSATLRHEFTEKLTGFMEFSTTQNVGDYHRSPLFWNILIPRTAAFNPFNQDIRVTIPSPGTDIQDDAKLGTYRAAAGFILALPHGWTTGLDFTQNRTQLTNQLIGRASPSDLATAIGNGTLQIFRDINQYPQDFTRYILPRIALSPTNTTLKDASLRVSGPLPELLSLPGGTPTISLLLEQRSEIFGRQVERYPTVLNPLTVRWTLYPQRSQDVDSVSLQTVLPIVSENNRIPGIRKLELEIAARYDRYDTHGTSTVTQINSSAQTPPALDGIVQHFSNKFGSGDPTVALRYQPIEDITFRASYGTGFLPPAANQLVDFGSFVDTWGGELLDPLRGDEPIYEVEFLGSGGGRDLNPELSESVSAGIVLTPRFLEGLRLSVDWIRIRKTDTIDFPLTYSQQDFDLEPYVPGLVVRGPRAPGDPFPVGPVIAFNTGMFNLGKLTSEAYDFSADYLLTTSGMGEFDFVLGATRLVSLANQISPFAPVTEYAGVGPSAFIGNQGDAGGLKWRTNATLTWLRSNWTLGWSIRYFDGYFLNVGHTVDPAQGSATIPSQVYNDVFGSYRFARGGITRFLPGESEVRFGVNNVLNKKPPMDVIGNGFASPGYSYFGDPRLANYYLSFQTNFGR